MTRGEESEERKIGGKREREEEEEGWGRT